MTNRQPRAVLIVEDEALLRLHLADIVEDSGYVPLEAKDADEAIAILSARSDIVLVITDIHMPGSLDGLKLAHAVRDRWPPIKIIVVSGKAQLSPSDMPAGARFLAKPFQASQMMLEMQSIIEG